MFFSRYGEAGDATSTERQEQKEDEVVYDRRGHYNAAPGGLLYDLAA